MLRQGNDPVQVGVGESFDLLRHGCSAALKVFPPGLQLLRQPAASGGSLQRFGHAIGLLQQLRQIGPDERVQGISANEPGLADRSGATADLMGLARAQVVPLAARQPSSHAGQTAVSATDQCSQKVFARRVVPLGEVPVGGDLRLNTIELIPRDDRRHGGDRDPLDLQR